MMPVDKLLIVFDGSLQDDVFFEKLMETGELVLEHKVDGDFAAHRNYALKFMPKGAWVIMLDADEMISPSFIINMRELLNSFKFDNSPIDLIRLSRINTYGETSDNPPTITEFPPKTFNYPDFQGRVFKNNGKCLFVGKIHEMITSYTEDLNLDDSTYWIIHHKTRAMQEKRDKFYKTFEPN